MNAGASYTRGAARASRPARADAARWALALGVSIAAHAAGAGVAMRFAPMRDGAAELRVRDGSAGVATVRVDFVAIEVEAERAKAPERAGGSVRPALEALARAREAMERSARGAAAARDALGEAASRTDDARALEASAVRALVESGLELGGAAGEGLERLEAFAARIGEAAHGYAASGAAAPDEPKAAEKGGSASAPPLGASTPARADAGNRAPEYPLAARRRGEEGVVVLRLKIDERGRVERAEVGESSGWPLLDGAAVRAARAWRFSPALRGGAPVASAATIPVRFRLTDAR